MLLLAAVLVATAAGLQLPTKPYYDLNDADNLLQQFLQKHGKAYNAEEYLRRLDIFKANLKEINERNARHPHTEYGVTRFTDLTSEERGHYLGVKRIDGSFEGLVTNLEYPVGTVTAPDQFDWRDHGVVTHVKDQGDCGSCWVFSATGVIEGQYAIKHKECVAFSEQHSVDCITPFSLNNCNGGFPHDVMKYFEQHGDFMMGVGIATEKEYPYTGHQDDCKEKSVHPVVNVTSARVYNMDEESMKLFLYKTGPLSIILNIDDFWQYKKGIAHPIKCKPESILNHALLLVGYGTENGTNYWTIKNSFGAKWGEEGYIRLVRGVHACGIGRYVAICAVP